MPDATRLVITRDPSRNVATRHAGGESDMLWTIFVLLLVAWLLGLVSSYTLGGYIHLLLLVAVAVLLIRIIQGRTPL